VSDPRRIDPAPQDWGATASPSLGRRVLHGLGELLQTLLIAAVLFMGINFVSARIRVEGSSMEPSLHDGEFVVVNRLAYRWAQPQRGDIVVFYYPNDPSRRFIKRVIGLPGDIVSVDRGQVKVNGITLDEPYILSAPRYQGTWSVGPAELFVLGDNRNNSLDSERWGMLPFNEVIGKATLVYWPIDEIGLIPHYNLTAAASN
jgi:signal peptidase I